MADFYRRRKKVCIMCEGKTLGYKDLDTIKMFISEKGKILPRRATGTCAKHQREVARQVKRAREIALIPYTAK